MCSNRNSDMSEMVVSGGEKCYIKWPHYEAWPKNSMKDFNCHRLAPRAQVL